MNTLSKDEIINFINALQLSIKNEIGPWLFESNNTLLLTFNRKFKDDDNLWLFQKLIKGSWDNIHYRIENAAEQITPLVTQFLLLTRLQKKNMLKLVELDVKYKEFVDRIYGTAYNISPELENMAQAAQIVFSQLEKQQMTMRQLSEKTGLTTVALSNFKAGKDIRLSNFIKICRAIGLKIKLD